MYCKLSKSDGSTRGGVVLIPGETVKVSGPVKLCETGLHFYSHPLLASFFRPIHVPDYATLWEGVPGGEIVHDGQVKSVCGAWKTVRKIDLPEISTEQRVEVAIRCAMQVIGDSFQAWSGWAEDWISGKDRSEAAARAARAEAAAEAAEAAAWAAARAAAWAAWAAAREAEAAAWAAEAAAEAAAARAAAWAAEAPAWAAEAEDVDILSIIKNVVGYESEGAMRKITEAMDCTMTLDGLMESRGISYLDVYSHRDSGFEQTIARWMIDLTQRLGISSRAAELEICCGIKSGKLVPAEPAETDD